MIVNTHTITMSGQPYTLQKYFTQVGRNGELSRNAQYAVSGANLYRDSMTAAELLDFLTNTIAFKFAHIPGVDKKANSIARDFMERLESSNDVVEVPVTRTDCGAPKLGRPGLPTRPLVAAY